jgi:hypothetical protein
MKNFSKPWRNLLPVREHLFSRPLVLFHSDDWGLAGIRDREGGEELRGAGLNLGESPYDSYSLETAEDLHFLYEVLLRHRDSVGRPPCMIFNYILANVDFLRVMESGYSGLPLLPLEEGFPGAWRRPGLLEAHGTGIRRGLIHPALHGVTHFCQRAAKRVMGGGDERASLLRLLYQAHTPMIPGRTPWLGFEYRDEPGVGGDGWLDSLEQRNLIQEGKNLFQRTFGKAPLSACAPGYRANQDTLRGWAEAGIRVVQEGPGFARAPYFDPHGLLHLHRNVPFEPALDVKGSAEEAVLEKAAEAFRKGRPAVLCMHSVNFHSTLRNHRDRTLEKLDRFLTLLESRFGDLLYLHDLDLWQILQEGRFCREGKEVKVSPRRRWGLSPDLDYYLRKLGVGQARTSEEQT